MSTVTSHHLAPEQIAEFHAEGYLVVENVFDADRLNAVAEEVTAVIDRAARQLVAEGVLSSTYEEYPFTSRLTHITAETEEVYKSRTFAQQP